MTERIETLTSAERADLVWRSEQPLSSSLDRKLYAKTIRIIDQQRRELERLRMELASADAITGRALKQLAAANALLEEFVCLSHGTPWGPLKDRARAHLAGQPAVHHPRARLG